MQLRSWHFDLRLRHSWAIARSVQSTGKVSGSGIFEVALVELSSPDGVTGLGEAAPSSRYQENAQTALRFLESVDPKRLSFQDLAGSMAYIESLAPGQHAAKGALNIALLDGAGQLAGKPIHDLFDLGFAEGKHWTSFSIGIDTPDMIRKKVLEAADYPILKLKVGSPDDRSNLGALREAAPAKTVRVDANEGWKTKEEALRQIEWLAGDPNIEFIEQPMPATNPPADFAWLKERSPLPIMADESYISAGDIQRCADCFHSVNVKLVKTGGITRGYEALKAARAAGLKTMLGCMIESSILITAAAHLAGLTDYLDIDGNLLINNDPYQGATADRGLISLANAPRPHGLRVAAR